MEHVHDAEKRMLKCFHCGSELKNWNPLCRSRDGIEYRAATPFKWCPNCCWITFKTLAIYLGFPEEDAELYISRALAQEPEPAHTVFAYSHAD